MTEQVPDVRIDEVPADGVRSHSECADAEETQTRLERVRRALAAQDNDAFRKRALRYAQQRARWLRNKGAAIHTLGKARGVPSREATELLHDAIADTWLGHVTWNPETRTLLQHVCVAIKRMTYKQTTHVRAHPHHPLDIRDVGDPLDDGSELEAAILDSARRERVGVVETWRVDGTLQVLLEDVERRCENDLQVRALVSCLRSQTFERLDICKQTGLTFRAYAAARHRLFRLMRRSSPERLELVRDMLRGRADHATRS